MLGKETPRESNKNKLIYIYYDTILAQKLKLMSLSPLKYINHSYSLSMWDTNLTSPCTINSILTNIAHLTKKKKNHRHVLYSFNYIRVSILNPHT